MSTVVGIDLGTTNTVVAAVQGGQASALPDGDGQLLIPSVVSFHPNGNVLVGRAAKQRRLVDARNTVYSIKRLIGRSWSSEEVTLARARFPFEMQEGPGQASLIVARGETYTLPEISAFVLRKAKSVAEAALGTSVERAVVTVPANFNDLQRAATKVAGRVAGLDVIRILNEPTAAALAYGYGRSSAERLAIYDFGGGTFDVTLLDLSENVFEVLATAGDTFLGGDDIDSAVAERMADAFLAQYRYDPRSDAQAFERLRVGAEELKLWLSTQEHATVDLPDVTHGSGGKPLSLRFSMSRADFERLTEPIIDRTFDVCREALAIAHKEARDFDQVLLVGGSTRIPLVKTRVEDFFQREALGHVSPDEVVAIGAAIQANALSGVERRKTGVPPPPHPLARGADPKHPPPLPPRRPGTFEAPATTEPFGRPRAHTAPGLNPHAQPGALLPPQPIVVQPPQALGGSAPETTPRTRTLDHANLSPDPAPDDGRPRTRTGLGAPPPPPRRGAALQPSTLASASEAARLARDSLPSSEDISVFDFDDDADEPTQITQSPLSESPQAEPPPQGVPLQIEQPRPASDFPRPAMTREEIEARYGNLPLQIPGSLTHGSSRAAPTALRRSSQPPPGEGERLLPIPNVPVGHARRASERPPAIHALPALTPWQPAAPGGYSPVGPPAPGPLQAGFGPHGMPSPPLLVDVTPLTLSVETVSGYCDPVIDRNTPVPCERTRRFVTAADGQSTVRVRVGQGESPIFKQNTLLGEVELSGLRQAPRGGVEISVTFALDSNGMLNVSAKDVMTGHATTTQVRMVGLPEADRVAELAARHAARHTP